MYPGTWQVKSCPRFLFYSWSLGEHCFYITIDLSKYLSRIWWVLYAHLRLHIGLSSLFQIHATYTQRQFVLYFIGLSRMNQANFFMTHLVLTFVGQSDKSSLLKYRYMVLSTSWKIQIMLLGVGCVINHLAVQWGKHNGISGNFSRFASLQGAYFYIYITYASYLQWAGKLRCVSTRKNQFNQWNFVNHIEYIIWHKSTTNTNWVYTISVIVMIDGYNSSADIND